MSVLKRIIFIIKRVFFCYLFICCFLQQDFKRACVELFGPLIGIAILIIGLAAFFDSSKEEEHGDWKLTLVLWIIGGACIFFWENEREYTQTEWFAVLAAVVTFAFFIFITARQSRDFKAVASWSDKKIVRICMKSGIVLYPLFMWSRIGYFVYSVITGQYPGSLFNFLTLALMIVGILLWILQAFVELKYRAWGKRPKRRPGADFKSGTISEVKNAMQTLAGYFSGGYSPYGSGRIRYEVSVDVNVVDNANVNVKFNVRCSLTGDGSSIRSAQSVVRERLDLIVNRARKKISEIDNSRTYNISAQIVQ